MKCAANLYMQNVVLEMQQGSNTPAEGNQPANYTIGDTFGVAEVDGLHLTKSWYVI